MTQIERVSAASRARRDQQREGLRRAILDAAAGLFLEDGYDSFSMRRIAERIGYSATTIYRYFDDKDALLFAVMDQGFVEFDRALRDAAASTDDLVERIARLGLAYVRFARENPAYYQMMFLQRGDYLAKAAEGSKETRGDSFVVLQNAVDAALAAGAIRPGDAREHANALWALVHGMAALAVVMPGLGAFTTDGQVEAAIRVALDGFRGSSEHPASRIQ